MIAIVYGTRPDALKLGPVVAELRGLGEQPWLICTGQHTTLLQDAPMEADLGGAQSLNLPSDGNVLRWLAHATRALVKKFKAQCPAVVVVQGDTMSAMAGARAADQLGVPIVHVEAGVRSHVTDDPWPEEKFRHDIDMMATLHLAPTALAAGNLRAEGHDITVVVTGQTGISALVRYNRCVAAKSPEPLVLVTLHRRELRFGNRAALIVRALLDFFARHLLWQCVWVTHPGMRQYLPTVWPSNMRLVEPMRYAQMIQTLVHSTGVLTDSGGLVEEAATLGIPTTILRWTNDRPEATDAGIAQRFDPTLEGVEAALDLLTSAIIPRTMCPVFGTHESASNAAKAIVRFAHAC